jgi:hypothetical protein
MKNRGFVGWNQLPVEVLVGDTDFTVQKDYKEYFTVDGFFRVSV